MMHLYTRVADESAGITTIYHRETLQSPSLAALSIRPKTSNEIAVGFIKSTSKRRPIIFL